MTREDILRFLATHKDELVREFRLRRIGLFGSFARGEEGKASDIDIVVEMENPDLFTLARLKEYLEEAFGRKVDLVRMRKHMNEFLRRRLEKEALYV
ncbi:MAG: nucleotidyltransferase family protein [Atribacterota bacterium]